MTYRAPVKDMMFAMTELAQLDTVAQLPGFEDAGPDTAAAVLEECARLNEGVIAPLNWEGDKAPSFLKDGSVTTTAGFKDAFRQFAEGGWQGLQHPTEYGGQGPTVRSRPCSPLAHPSSRRPTSPRWWMAPGRAP
jgi:alkylation response protein AidB-like acyl-CoA dehydrogenase